MNRRRNCLVRKRVATRHSVLLMGFALAACEGSQDLQSTQLAQCECDPGVYRCTLDDGAQCVIDGANGAYDISGASDVTVRTGAAEYTVRDQSGLTLNDGKAYVSAADTATVTVDGGMVLRATLLDGASFALAGGIGADISLSQNATLEIGSGDVYRLNLSESSSATLYEGTVLTIDMRGDATFAVTGGSIDDVIRATDRSATTVSGGEVHAITGDGESTSTIEGGFVEVLITRTRAMATVKGGAVSYISATDGPWEQTSTVTVVGTGFNYPFGPVDKSALALSDDDGATRQGPLTATLVNGDRLDTQVFLGTEANLYLCPPDNSGNCPCSFPDFRRGTCSFEE